MCWAVIQTLRYGGRSLKTIFFLPFGAQFGVKIRGGLGAGSPGPFPGSATEFVIIQVFLSYLSVDVSSDCVFR